MTGLLHLDSSHSGDSVSKRLSSLFAETWRERNGEAGYRYRDLAADPVPLISPAYCALGRRVERHGYVSPAKVPSLVEGAAEEREWALTLPLIEELLAADTVLVGGPMYNFSASASLKAWIDRVTFPGAYADPDSGESLLRGTRVVVVTARGGAYGPGTPREGFDFQEPYLRTYFTNLGVAEEDLAFVHAEMTLASLVPDLAHLQPVAERSLAAARAAITDLVARS
ncbi:FMN-dependent NADH-azoreductase [Actinoallomurus iriomotensis]|uniref:FMN dependent NADH:quinone oxidoreductase n=1 Tax=Actinoallomurus iriomotensis TaxID=478107 RepID=A0A9W6RRF4_9ACTN|nr:NAD(P)H-dependent oxidoreductase [Actinoallomurus iriomotensis]GLY81161.1 FMN-dependent NADH-azoreductase [Actinoallomurus iriomotensis]